MTRPAGSAAPVLCGVCELLTLFPPGRRDAFVLDKTSFNKPLSEYAVRQHLAGKARLGLYLLTPEGRCHWAAIDLDGVSRAAVLDLTAQASAWGVDVPVEKSKSKGWHLYVFFAEWVPAAKARALLRGLIATAGWDAHRIELFPKQDTPGADGKGNVLYMPWHGGSVAEGRCLFVNIADDQWPPYPDQAAYLASVPRLTTEDLDRLLAEHTLNVAPSPPPSPSNGGGENQEKGTTTLPLPPCADRIYREGVTSPGRSDWCHFLARHLRRRGLPEEAVVGLLREWNRKNRPEPLPEGKVGEMVRSAYAKAYTSLGCEYLPGAKELCGGACPVERKAERVTAAADETEADREARSRSPELCREGDTFRLTWPNTRVVMRLDRLQDGRGLAGDLTVEAADQPLHWGRLWLANTRDREELVRKLDRLDRARPWRALLDQACQLVAEAVRQGVPTVRLTPAPAPEARCLVEPLLPLGETAVLFGDGGSGKSLLALALGVAVSTGCPLPGGLRMTSSPRPVLFLDWESCQEEQAARLAGLLAGLGLADAEVHYRPMVRPLADDAPRIRAEIARLDAGAVIVDSFGPALGAEPEGADGAIRAFNALRSFAPATRLVVAHVSKVEADRRSGASRPYGSVYVQNLARSVWEIRRAEEDDEALTLGLYHRKVNAGRLRRPLGLRFTFAAGTIRLQAHDLDREPDLLGRTSLGHQILQTLGRGAVTVEELAETLGGSEESVGRVLRRLRTKGKVVRLDDGRWGLAVP